MSSELLQAKKKKKNRLRKKEKSNRHRPLMLQNDRLFSDVRYDFSIFREHD